MSCGFHIFYSSKGQAILKANISGQAQGGLNRDNLLNIRIPIPPKEIQEKIVLEIEVLEKQEESARQKIEDNEHKIFNLTSDFFEKYKPKKLSEIIELQNGKGLTKKEMINGIYPVYGGNGINGYHNDFLSEESTIAIGRVGEYCGAIHLTHAKAWITDNSMFVKKFKIECNKRYISICLNHLNLNQYSSQASHPNISQPVVFSKSIPWVDINEQNEIVQQIEKFEAQIAELQKLNDFIPKEKELILKKYLE